MSKEILEKLEALQSDIETKTRSFVETSNKESQEKLEAQITELRSAMDEVIAKSQAPSSSSKEDQAIQQRKAFEAYIRTGDKKAALEVRALTGASTTGGFMVSPDFEARIIKQSIELNNLARIVRNRTTGSDTVITGSYVDLTSTAWGNAAPAGEDATGAQTQIDIKKLKVLVKIPMDAIEDSEADVVADVEDLASRAFAVAEREAMTNGGANAVIGFKTNATVQAAAKITAAVAGLGTDQEIIDSLNSMIYSITGEDANGAVFTLNRTTLGVLASVLNADGKNIYDPSTNKLLGYEVIENASMDAHNVTGKFPIIFGNFNEYSRYTRKDLSVIRLDEKYAEEGNLGLLFEKRVGGDLTRAAALVALKVQ